jgi:ABC-type Zn uptake system ZnuABC Zn-binding protein ZnuA
VTRPLRSIRAALGIAAAAALVAGACGGGGTPSSAPVVTVVTGLSPLAQIASEVGGAHVRVIDVVADGTDPRTATLDAATTAQVRAAGVVLVVGGGYQPALEAAAATAPRVVALTPTFGAPADGPWLDPTVITRWAGMVASTLSAANPAAAGTYRNGARDVAAEMSSLSADYQNSLSDCPRKAIVTPDTTWSALSRSVGLTDRPIGASASPDASSVQAAVTAVRVAGAKTVFSEPWVPDGTVTAAAAATGTKVRQLDTLAGVPAGGWPKGATFTRLMENDLTVLTSALQCAQMGQN